MTPLRETSPTGGFNPTSPQFDEGQTIEPSVSVPIPMAPRLAAIEAPVPELDPHGLRRNTYGLCVCPPRPDHPLDELEERKFAHSLRLVLPRITAPASRSCLTKKASCFGAGASLSARLPAVVFILSAVSMLSLINTGMPWSIEGTFPALRCRSR